MTPCLQALILNQPDVIAPNDQDIGFEGAGIRLASTVVGALEVRAPADRTLLPKWVERYWT
jgi:hypothetical protein